ncbi:MAG: hypothetical protein ACOYM3_04715 [Terrimicrobiaceae bacterium]
MSTPEHDDVICDMQVVVPGSSPIDEMVENWLVRVAETEFPDAFHAKYEVVGEL